MVKCLDTGRRYNSSYDGKMESRMHFGESAASTHNNPAPRCMNCGSRITADAEMSSGVIYCCSDCTLTLGLVLFFKKLKQFN
ncbi:MAG: hypothetical protein JNK43_05545 [Ignavibacteria bacterium]|nr:hypothetical protein [Ignavibacteria bacterium]